MNTDDPIMLSSAMWLLVHWFVNTFYTMLTYFVDFVSMNFAIFIMIPFLLIVYNFVRSLASWAIYWLDGDFWTWKTLVSKDVIDYQAIRKQNDDSLDLLEKNTITKVREFTYDFYLVRKATRLKTEADDLLRLSQLKNKINFTNIKDYEREIRNV